MFGFFHCFSLCFACTHLFIHSLYDLSSCTDKNKRNEKIVRNEKQNQFSCGETFFRKWRIVWRCKTENCTIAATQNWDRWEEAEWSNEWRRIEAVRCRKVFEHTARELPTANRLTEKWLNGELKSEASTKLQTASIDLKLLVYSGTTDEDAYIPEFLSIICINILRSLPTFIKD